MKSPSQTTLRNALDYIKSQSGTGSKARKQEKFQEIYTNSVGHIVTGERYDDAGVGPATAKSAVQRAFGEVPEADTLSEGVAQLDVDGDVSIKNLVERLDRVAELSGQEQEDYLVEVLEVSSEPSLVTLALLDDESLSLGTSQMRETFFDGTRDERKNAEAFVETTTEFIELAKSGDLPTGPTIGQPFEPMLAVPESRGEPNNPVVQEKVDGYRLLIHISEDSTKAFSRRSNDVTESLPELQEIDWPDGEYIVDCEVLAETGSYADTSKRIGRKAENIDRDVEMTFQLFDLVYQNSDISARPYNKRYNRLCKFADYVDDSRVNVLEVTDDIEQALDNAIAQGNEGIIVKDNTAPYEYGKRSTYWQKRKLDANTVDCVVSGFVEGDGRLTGTLGKIELETSDGVSIGYSGSGFSDEQRDKIWNNKDEWFGRVVEIEARGLGTGDNLRMPIFKRDRSDDGEADSMERVKEIMKNI